MEYGTIRPHPRLARRRGGVVVQKSDDVRAAGYNSIDLICKRLESLAMLPLIARPGIDRRCALRDVSVTKNNAHNMRRKTQIAEQCCYGTAEIVSVPT